MPLLSRLLPALAALPLMGACSGAALLNTITPAGAYDRTKNVAYGDGDRQVMDIYRTDADTPETPVLMFVHGGGWNARDKADHRFVADGFAKSGFDIVLPNYRLYPGMQYPDMVEDTGAAIRATTERFPGRPLVLIGHSAGAYNILQAVVAPEVSNIEPCRTVAGVVALAAPTGIIGLTSEPYISIFPEHRLTGPDGPAHRTPDAVPPILLVNGDADTTVYPANSTDMAARYQALGLPVEARIYPGMTHVDAVKVLSRHFDGDSPLKGDILAFIDGLDLSDRDYCTPR